MSEQPPDTTRPRGRRALGRGLEALMPSAVPAGAEEIEVGRIDPNPHQPRVRFAADALEELAKSIREHGVVQPLLVSAVEGGRFRLIVGERRLQASKLAGLQRVPVVIRDAGDQQSLELALIENVQRADLDPLEEAAAFQRLMQDFGLTQQQVAERVGKSRAAIANTVRLLVLPELVKRALIEQRISEGHARALLAVPDRQVQLSVLARIEREQLNVRQTEALIRRLLQPSTTTAPVARRDPDVEAAEDQLRRALGTKVSLRHGKRGGKIVIEYFSAEEFDGLYERLTRQE